APLGGSAAPMGRAPVCFDSFCPSAPTITGTWRYSGVGKPSARWRWRWATVESSRSTPRTTVVRAWAAARGRRGVPPPHAPGDGLSRVVEHDGEVKSGQPIASPDPVVADGLRERRRD